MARKARNRTKPKVDRQRVVETSPPGSNRATIHYVTGNLADTLEALVTGCAILALGPVPGPFDDGIDEIDELDDIPEELLDLFDDDSVNTDTALGAGPDNEPAEDDGMDPEFSGAEEAYGGVMLTTRILARGLLAHALGRELHLMPNGDPESDDDTSPEAEAAGLRALTETLLPSNLPDAIRPPRAARHAAIREAALLIREVGLEEFDVSCHLATTHDGVEQLVTYPVSPPSAHVALLEYLFDRAEVAALEIDPVLAVERTAAAWEFSQWSVEPPPGRLPPEAVSFPRRIREQEYSLADRPMAALGGPMVAQLISGDGFSELFPRQHRTAVGLGASFTDVFECLAIDGSRATLRSARHGGTYEVHEHMDPIVYASGWIGFGRLLPFEGTLHLRSPGMIFVPPDKELVTAAVAALDRLSTALPPALALEATISSVVFGRDVPAKVKPAPSRSDARALLDTIAVLNRGVELDSRLMPFIMALATQAESSAGGQGKRRKHPKKRTKHNRRPKRRR